MDILGDTLLSAPAGSGKTYWIGQQVNSLVASGVDPKNILCVTFSNLAKMNLKESIQHKVCIETTHSLIAKHLLKNSKILVDDESVKMLMRDIMYRHRISCSVDKLCSEVDYLRTLCLFLAKYKTYKEYNSLLKSEFLLNKYKSQGRQLFNGVVESDVQRVLVDYQKEIVKGIVDFKELIIGGYYYCTFDFEHMFIDEFQDTGYDELIMLLNTCKLAKLHLLFDRNQSIYGWRGVKLDKNLSMLMKLRSFQEDKMIDIYRSSSEIVELGNILLGSKAGISVRGSGKVIETLQFDTHEEESKEVVSRILGEVNQYDSICVLARRNKDLTIVLDEFERLGVRTNHRDRVGLQTDAAFSIFKSMCGLASNQFDTMAMRNLMSKLRVGNPARLSPSVELYGQSYIGKLLYGESTVVVFDVETTGLDFEEDRVIQISAVKLDKNFNVIEEFDRLISGDRSVGTSVLTHHFTDEYLRENGDGSREVFEDFIRFSHGCVLVGHNVNYDRTMLKVELARNSIPFHWNYLTDFYCTLDLCRALFDLPMYKLEYLNSAFNLGANPNHNALEDVKATALLLRVCCQELHKVKCSLSDSLPGEYALVIEALSKAKVQDIVGIYIKVMGDLRGREFVERMCKERPYLEDIFSQHIGKLSGVSSVYQELVFGAKLMKNKISVLTVHQSKGLGFDKVYLINNVSGFSDSEEEVRIQYVATTRAKDELVLTAPESRSYNRVFTEACKC